jgi:capsular polysaccharide transport system permease protein
MAQITAKPLAPISRLRFAGMRTIAALMLREMATTYGRSPGGYLWAVLDPVAAVTLLSLFFSITFHAPPLGSNFVLFYATGYLPMVMYTDISAKVGQSIRYSRPLLAYPRVTYVDAILGRFLLNSLTHMVVMVIIIAGVSLIYDVPIEVKPAVLAQGLGMVMILALGVGTLNCYLSSTFPLWERIFQIANRPLFLISGVFFLVDSMGEPYRSGLLYNPLSHVIAKTRSGFYATYDAPLISPLYVYMIGTLCLFFGMLLLNRYHKDILNGAN